MEDKGDYKLKQDMAIPEIKFVKTKSLINPIWAVGMTVAFRQKPTVKCTVESLALAGWADPYLFCEPDANDLPKDTLTLFNDTVLGCWGNFCRRLRYLVRMQASHLLLVQDDVEFLPDTRMWLEDNWPCNEGMVSLYRSALYMNRPEDTYEILEHNRNFLGTLAVAMPMALAKSLVLNLDKLTDIDTKCDDLKLGKFLHALRIPMNIVSRSRCQHIGQTSSIYKHTTMITSTRKADTYDK